MLNGCVFIRGVWRQINLFFMNEIGVEIINELN